MIMPDRCAHIEEPSTRSVPGGRFTNRTSPRAGPDGADHRAVGKDAAYTGRSIETGIGEQLADDERPGRSGPSSSAFAATAPNTHVPATTATRTNIGDSTLNAKAMLTRFLNRQGHLRRLPEPAHAHHQPHGAAWLRLSQGAQRTEQQALAADDDRHT